MDSELLSLLCDPDTRYSFELDGNSLRNTATGRVYPIRDEMPLFVSTVTGSNLKYKNYYDRIAKGYDMAERVYAWFTRRPDCRREILNELEISSRSRVLEVAVGTGANVRLLPRDIEFYGVDLSWGMLQQCRRNLTKWGLKGNLFQCEAERLPFRAEIFDCVFHVGGINFFTDKVRAIKEMIWVARPGSKIVIVDETEKATKSGADVARCPIDAIPEEMQELKVREIADGRLYCLTFRKPFELIAAQRPRASEGSAVRSAGANSPAR
jgi:ubiquinone/menaquinone biosynthesis C-methylase UbiE